MKKIKLTSLFMCLCIAVATIAVAATAMQVYNQSEYEIEEYRKAYMKEYTGDPFITYDEDGTYVDMNEEPHYSIKESFLRPAFQKVFAIITLALFALMLVVPYRHLKETKLYRWITTRIRYEWTLLFSVLLASFYLHMAPYGIFTLVISDISVLSIFDSELWHIAGTLIIFFVSTVLMFFNVCVLTLLFKHIVHTHSLSLLKQNSLIYRNFDIIKKKVNTAFTYLKTIDLKEQNNRRLLCKIILHFLIISFFTLFETTGIFFALIYCFFLFLYIRNQQERMKQDFSALEESIQYMADGNLSDELNTSMGMYEPLREPLENIQTIFQEAVEQEVRSQNMKTELITNVSHDLKTPLTSIISYIDLLKKEDLTPEERASYLMTLEKSSARLKHLIEDLFEVSKANSNNVTLNYMQVDIISLIQQVEMECERLYSEHQLTLRHTFTQDKILLTLDPQKTYRIFENLISNAGKYALPNSRVYIEIKEETETVDIWIKNISASELDFHADDIMERFVRGDKARNSEGSGLGLAIVKSFTELQNGHFDLSFDGDLFKAHIQFQKEANQPDNEVAST